MAVIVTYPDKTYTRRISISILQYRTLYTRPTSYCINRSVNALLLKMVYQQQGGEHCFSLKMYVFCSNKALYSVSLSFTTFIGPAAVTRQVLQKRFRPSFPLSRCFLRICIVFLFWNMVLETHITLCVTGSDFLEKLLLSQTLGKWVKIGPKIVFFEFLN